MKILVFEKKDIHPDAIALLERAGHDITDDISLLDQVEAIFVRTYTQVNAGFLADCHNLKYIIKAGVGLDNIDLAACKDKGILVFNSPGANAHSVAELAIGFIIFLMRKVHAQIDSLEQQTWRQRQFLGNEVSGKTIGVLGCGAVGKLVAKQIAGFEVRQVLGYDPFLTAEQLTAVGIVKAELDEVLSQADMVVLSIPLTPDTYNLITLDKLKMMKKTSYIINVSRGGIINENDLCYALNNDLIAGAALDVFENEPVGINPQLLKCKNLIATPHIGGFTVEGDKAICVAAAANFLRALNS